MNSNSRPLPGTKNNAYLLNNTLSTNECIINNKGLYFVTMHVTKHCCTVPEAPTVTSLDVQLGYKLVVHYWFFSLYTARLQPSNAVLSYFNRYQYTPI